MNRAMAPTLFMKAEATMTMAVSRASRTTGPPFQPAQPVAQGPRDPGQFQGPADDQHRRHRDHRRVAEAGKGLTGRDHPGKHHGQQRQKRHHIVAPPAVDEQ